MKIVQINTFPYKATGNIMLNIHRLLKENGHDSYVVWGRGRGPSDDHEINMGNELDIKLHGIYTRLTDKTGFGSIGTTKKLIETLKNIKPDIIHLHNIHGYYINIELLFDFIKKNDIKVVWTLHDCWAFTGHCAYFDACGCNNWKTGCSHCPQKGTYPSSLIIDNSSWNWNKKKSLFSDLNATLVTPSNWLKDLTLQSFLGFYPIKVIHNGIDTEVFKPSSNNNLRKKYNLDDRPIILGVASEWTERKGLNDIIKLSTMLTEYQFVAVGVTDKQKSQFPSSLKGILRTDNQNELAELYSLASVFFNPTYEDNFPTTNLEALACGTPVVTYNTGGSPESLTEITSIVITKDSPTSVDLIKVKNAIIEAVSSSISASEQCRLQALKFDKNNKLSEYIKLYEEL